MLLSADLISFLAEPVTLIVGTRGEGFAPDIARGVGLRAPPGNGTIEVMISQWQWPAAVANLQANGALALTASAPRTYRTYQFKGRASVRPAQATDVVVAAGYVDRMLALFTALAMPESFAGQWFSLRDLVVARLAVAEVFVQTPGPRAGLPAEGGA